MAISDKSICPDCSVYHGPTNHIYGTCEICGKYYGPGAPKSWAEMPDPPVDDDWERLKKKYQDPVFDKDRFIFTYDPDIPLEWPKLHWPSFQEGGYVPNDRPAVIHKSETIVPMDEAIYLLENMSQSLQEIAKTLQELKDAEDEKL